MYLFLTSGDFCHLMMTFINSNCLDPDPDSVGPDVDPNQLTTLIVPLKEFFEKVNLKLELSENLTVAPLQRFPCSKTSKF